MKPFYVIVKKERGAYCYTAWGTSSAEVLMEAIEKHGACYVRVEPLND